MKNEEESKSQIELDETTEIRCIFTQFMLKGVIKKFGEDGENSGLEEMKQLHGSSAFKTLDWK